MMWTLTRTNKIVHKQDYALEARDFGNSQDMVNKALVLQNRRGVMERKHKQER
jgi:hypothetical protein